MTVTEEADTLTVINGGLISVMAHRKDIRKCLRGPVKAAEPDGLADILEYGAGVA